MTAVNHPLFLFLRALVRASARAYLHLTGSFRVECHSGAARMKPPFMIICNHVALSDSLYVGCAFRSSFVICGGKARLFASHLRRWLMRIGNVLQFASSDEFVADCTALLMRGRAILIYPELGRHDGRMGPFSELPARIALATGCLVVPCYISGTARRHGGKGVWLVVGAPITPQGTSAELTVVFRQSVERLGSALLDETAAPCEPIASR